MFIHGGYWQAMDKAEHGLVAPHLTKEGIAVVVPNYGLGPSVSMHEIVRQVERAACWVLEEGPSFGLDATRFVVSGHSAGGHPTAMLMSDYWRASDSGLAEGVFSGGVAISGLYDLREIPLVPSVNRNTRLDLAQALELSPMFRRPATDAPLHLVAGRSELERFQSQQRAFAAEWKGVATETYLPVENHYSILLQFTRPDSPLLRIVRSAFLRQGSRAD